MLKDRLWIFLIASEFWSMILYNSPIVLALLLCLSSSFCSSLFSLVLYYKYPELIFASLRVSDYDISLPKSEYSFIHYSRILKRPCVCLLCFTVIMLAKVSSFLSISLTCGVALKIERLFKLLRANSISLSYNSSTTLNPCPSSSFLHSISLCNICKNFIILSTGTAQSVATWMRSLNFTFFSSKR